jgi:hypothetical protein
MPDITHHDLPNAVAMTIIRFWTTTARMPQASAATTPAINGRDSEPLALAPMIP